MHCIKICGCDRLYIVSQQWMEAILSTSIFLCVGARFSLYRNIALLAEAEKIAVCLTFWCSLYVLLEEIYACLVSFCRWIICANFSILHCFVVYQIYELRAIRHHIEIQTVVKFWSKFSLISVLQKEERFFVGYKMIIACCICFWSFWYTIQQSVITI